MDETQLNQHLADIFFVESAEMLYEASSTLLKAETASNSNEAIHKVFRMIHSIKGSAQSLGFEALAEVAHCMEEFMLPFRYDEEVVDSHSVSLMLESMDIIESQLQAYQAREIPPQRQDFLTKLAEVTALSIEKKAGTVSNNPKVAYQEVVNPNLRFLYLSFAIDQTAIMPSITAFMLLERLRNEGRILYSQPDMDDSPVIDAGEVFKQVAVVETTICNESIQQEAYRIGDIYDLNIIDIGNLETSNIVMPTKQEIQNFNYLVRNMWKKLNSKQKNKKQVHELATQILEWGIVSHGEGKWFPGGAAAWQRFATLLVDSLTVKDHGRITRQQSLALQTLQILWETVYYTLCGHTYFYSFSASEFLSKNQFETISQLEAKTTDLQIIIVDLSLWEILDGKDLMKLDKIRNEILKQEGELYLISNGDYTRRHINVLEIAQNVVGQFDFQTSIYSAIITNDKCG